MEKTTIPVYECETNSDPDFKTIFSEVKVGESYLMKQDGYEWLCKRVGEWEVVIPKDENYPETHIIVNKKYEWLSRG